MYGMVLHGIEWYCMVLHGMVKRSELQWSKGGGGGAQGMIA